MWITWVIHTLVRNIREQNGPDFLWEAQYSWLQRDNDMSISTELLLEALVCLLGSFTRRFGSSLVVSYVLFRRRNATSSIPQVMKSTVAAHFPCLRWVLLGFLKISNVVYLFSSQKNVFNEGSKLVIVIATVHFLKPPVYCFMLKTIFILSIFLPLREAPNQKISSILEASIPADSLSLLCLSNFTV